MLCIEQGPGFNPQHLRFKGLEWKVICSLVKPWRVTANLVSVLTYLVSVEGRAGVGLGLWDCVTNQDVHRSNLTSAMISLDVLPLGNPLTLSITRWVDGREAVDVVDLNF